MEGEPQSCSLGGDKGSRVRACSDLGFTGLRRGFSQRTAITWQHFCKGWLGRSCFCQSLGALCVCSPTRAPLRWREREGAWRPGKG